MPKYEFLTIEIEDEIARCKLINALSSWLCCRNVMQGVMKSKSLIIQKVKNKQ